MSNFLRVLQFLLVAMVMLGCQNLQRKVVVVDSQTDAPVSGAFVYAVQAARSRLFLRKMGLV